MIKLHFSIKRLFLALNEFIPITNDNFSSHFLLYQNLNKKSLYIVSFHIFKDRFAKWVKPFTQQTISHTAGSFTDLVPTLRMAALLFTGVVSIALHVPSTLGKIWVKITTIHLGTNKQFYIQTFCKGSIFISLPHFMTINIQQQS